MMCYNCVCEKHPTSSFKEGECYICEFESTLANYQQSLGKARQHIDAERSLNQELQSKLDAMTMSRDSFRAAYEKAHEGERHEIRLNEDGSLDEIVGHGRFHLEQMNTNEWFLELAGCAVWVSGKKVEIKPRDQISWAEAQKESLVERREIKS